MKLFRRLALSLALFLSLCGFFTPGQISAPISASSGYSDYDAVLFDGTNDYLSRGAVMTGAADGPQGIFSMWVNVTSLAAANFPLSVRYGGGALFSFRTDATTGKVRIILSNIAGTSTYTYVSSVAVSLGVWTNILASWDMNAGAGSKTMKLMLNGVQDTGATITDADLAFNVAYGALSDGWNVASQASFPAYTGCMAEFYFNTVTYMDVTQASNLAKFYSAGKPVNLGTVGATPTGTQPLVLDHIAAAASATGFGTNLGSGGGWTIIGALDLCSTKP